MQPLILVIGPPRSGTSITARILHERLGICMGHNLVPGNLGNPKGFYEDPKVMTALMKVITLMDGNLNLVTDAVLSSHSVCKKNIWGIKSPELAFIDFKLLMPQMIIRTHRSREAIASSLVKWHQPTLEIDEARLMVDRYEQNINERLSGILSLHIWNLDLHKHRDESDIERELRHACSFVD